MDQFYHLDRKWHHTFISASPLSSPSQDQQVPSLVQQVSTQDKTDIKINKFRQIQVKTRIKIKKFGPIVLSLVQHIKQVQDKTNKEKLSLSPELRPSVLEQLFKMMSGDNRWHLRVLETLVNEVSLL